MGRIAFDEMCSTVTRAFVNAGMSEDKALRSARVHTESSLDAVYSHGLNRVPRFVEYLQKGWVDADAEPTLLRDMGPMEVYDGQRGPGILNALTATDRTLELAAQHGLAIVALRNTTHWMRGGAYGWRAAEQGKILIAWTNTESCMPAWGAKDTRLGNNPFVMAVPRKEGPVVLDMAMSQYSYGKLQTTRLKGEQLPYAGGFDVDGNLTTDPVAIEESRRILPTGFWKGSGLAIMLDILAAALSEGSATHQIDGIDQGSCTGCSQIFIAFDPDRLGTSEHLQQAVNGMVDYVNGSQPADPNRAVTHPGQNTVAARMDQQKNGILVDDDIWREVVSLAG
ncbi:2,3-diketo-L-gulonate reductase [Rhodobacteraceae bacterium THAF1]|uniref:3-dehydro-L-gulonate 2-dehydrogenase n=1 Tax=Palleronia sp. THAF1 TaxID=2587842 RepID=UPI000F3CB55D|nr:3-dehydro-L-gulonate 2-dehydrogenase [Palleronia sp. THAF1]QFU08833.1 2,3-diketo-L-gulonate reductase [Palleronia sp. THAF1]VDC23968.1 2,3-diketo-L-gulonate reductase [Rhodobacteraceae bacterium THAF1]